MKVDKNHHRSLKKKKKRVLLFDLRENLRGFLHWTLIIKNNNKHFTLFLLKTYLYLSFHVNECFTNLRHQ